MVTFACSRSRSAAGGGYGLFLVDAMADRWGTSPMPHGTRVWFELDVADG